MNFMFAIWLYCCHSILLFYWIGFQRGVTWRQTLSPSWLHKLGVCTNGFTDFAEMPHLLENIKVWIQYNAALWRKLNSMSTPRENLFQIWLGSLIRCLTDAAVALTISPITWLSLCPVRLTPRIPNTTKTMAPVSTRGRTAGRPHTPPLHGLKPKVLDALVLAADEEPLKTEPERNPSSAFIYTV